MLPPYSALDSAFFNKPNTILHDFSGHLPYVHLNSFAYAVLPTPDLYLLNGIHLFLSITYYKYYFASSNFQPLIF